MVSGKPASSFCDVLGAFVADSRPGDVPPAVMHEAKRSLLNYFGVALGGIGDAPVQAALGLLDDYSGPRQATVIGSAIRLDALGAAFVNAASANALEFDDTHVPTIIHPTAPVAPPLFALAEARPASGAALLQAFALGVDVACRAGNAVHPGHYSRGWHVTSTCGVLGAAAASAKLLGLSAKQTSFAIGIAASQASGLVENLPTGAKNAQIGNSARSGLFAALYAARGATASPTALEGANGWARAMGDAPDADAFIGQLGERWEILRNTYKAYPCGIVLAPVIDACLALRAGHAFAADAIAAVTVRGNPLLLVRADRPEVANDRIAKLSIQHAVAVSLNRGAAGVVEFSQPVIDDPAIAEFRGRVTAVGDAALPVSTAVVAVTTRAGRVLECTVDAARGSPERPLADSELEAKLRDLARHGGHAIDVSALIDAVWQIDRVDDAGRVMALVRPR